MPAGLSTHVCVKVTSHPERSLQAPSAGRAVPRAGGGGTLPACLPMRAESLSQQHLGPPARPSQVTGLLCSAECRVAHTLTGPESRAGKLPEKARAGMARSAPPLPQTGIRPFSTGAAHRGQRSNLRNRKPGSPVLTTTQDLTIVLCAT